MNKSQKMKTAKLVSEGLSDVEAYNHRRKVPMGIYSVYLPLTLIAAFRQVCNEQDEKHSTVARHIIAEYIGKQSLSQKF